MRSAEQHSCGSNDHESARDQHGHRPVRRTGRLPRGRLSVRQPDAGHDLPAPERQSSCWATSVWSRWRIWKFSCIPEEYVGSYAAPGFPTSARASIRPSTFTRWAWCSTVCTTRITCPSRTEHAQKPWRTSFARPASPCRPPIYADYGLAGIIQKACSFKIDDRYQTPEGLEQALTLYMQRNRASRFACHSPIVASDEPIVPARNGRACRRPVRMTDVEQLDENFRRISHRRTPRAPERPSPSSSSRPSSRRRPSSRSSARRTTSTILIASVNAVVGSLLPQSNPRPLPQTAR